MVYNRLHNYFAMPGCHHDITYKINHKGVTKLENGRTFKTRVSGSRTHSVLPDGTLVDNKTRDKLRGPVELSKIRVPRKKPAQADPDSEKAATEKAEPKKREYFVNEKLISARVFSYVLAMKIPVLHAVTISFPPCVDDNKAFKYLNNWLTVAKDSLHLREHLFVSERQQNGTIHFHILIPQYFNIVLANRAMTRILTREVREKKLNWNISAAKRYNGIDIAKDRKTKKVTNFGEPKKRRNLIAYITKYISKGKKPEAGEYGKGFTHLAWHNSRGFSSMFTGVTLTETEKNFLGFGYMVNRARKFVGEFFQWCPWKNPEPPKFLTVVLRCVNQLILYQKQTAICCKLKFA